MKILGIGMTGCLAGYAFKNSVILEKQEAPNTHDAILRFRSEEVSNLTGIPFKKVKVVKGIYSYNSYVAPSLFYSNSYSLKVTGGIYNRSIDNISSETRFIAPVDFHRQMIDTLSSEGRVWLGADIEIDTKEVTISTLPLFVIAEHLGVNIPAKTSSESIFVTTIKLSRAEIYQTLYFPTDETSVYRASISGDILIIEAIRMIDDLDIEYVTRAFCACGSMDILINNKIQKIGKIIPIESERRKQIMFDLTITHNIYSLGRLATWRNILLDDVVKDIKQIERMLKTSSYDRALGATK